MFKLFALTFAVAISMHMPRQDGSSAQEQILTELRQIRTLLETKLSAPAAPNVGLVPSVAMTSATIAVGSAPFIGSKGAPVTIVEFTDFQCPYCSRFFLDTFPSLKRNYVDSGQVRFYTIDYPLAIHANALRAAQAGRCANDQSRFWQMHALMQANPQHLELKDLIGYAREAELEMAGFRECLDSEKYKKDVQDQMSEALGVGVRGTPTFVIGKSTTSGVEGMMFVGAEPYARFDKILQDVLKTLSAGERVQPETKGQ